MHVPLQLALSFFTEPFICNLSMLNLILEYEHFLLRSAAEIFIDSTISFFLNGDDLSLNSVNSANLKIHSIMNWGQSKEIIYGKHDW